MRWPIQSPASAFKGIHHALHHLHERNEILKKPGSQSQAQITDAPMRSAACVIYSHVLDGWQASRTSCSASLDATMHVAKRWHERGCPAGHLYSLPARKDADRNVGQQLEHGIITPAHFLPLVAYIKFPEYSIGSECDMSPQNNALMLQAMNCSFERHGDGRTSSKKTVATCL